MELMDGGLFDLEDPMNPEEELRTPMTSVQRQMIRELFAQIGVTDAHGQFQLVADLTGVRITSVGDLEVAAANVLIRQLKGRVANMSRANTGDAWADREEDTWIDRL